MNLCLNLLISWICYLRLKLSNLQKNLKMLAPRINVSSDVSLSEGYTSNNSSQMFCCIYRNVDVLPGKEFFRILFVLMLYNDLGFWWFWITAILWSFDLQTVLPRFDMVQLFYTCYVISERNMFSTTTNTLGIV